MLFFLLAQLASAWAQPPEVLLPDNAHSASHAMTEHCGAVADAPTADEQSQTHGAHLDCGHDCPSCLVCHLALAATVGVYRDAVPAFSGVTSVSAPPRMMPDGIYRPPITC